MSTLPQRIHEGQQASPRPPARPPALQVEDLDRETAGLVLESAGRLRLHLDHEREQAAYDAARQRHDEEQREARRAEAERLAGLIADHPDLFLPLLVSLLGGWIADVIRRSLSGRLRG
jgi:hypothetical protein